MIEGFKLKVASSELKTHCFGRAEYHRKRATEKEAELPKVKEAMEAIRRGGGHAAAGITHMNKNSYNLDTTDVVENLENDIKDHKNKAMVFDFFGNHLFAEDYTLKEDDLIRLEILKR